MKNTTILGGIILLIVLIGGFVFLNSDSSVNGNIVSNDVEMLNGEIQQAILTQDGLNYENIEVEAGKSIAISADSSVKGCLRSVVFNIDGEKYSKFLATPEDTLILPALDKGTYNFACSMGMGFGSLVAE